MTIISYDKCPLCKSNAIKKRFTCIDKFATGEEFDIYECDNCGLAFTQNIPDEKEIGRYYESPSYISHSNTNKGFVNTVYHLVRMIMLRNKARLVERLTILKNGNILDYGAGTGYFARTMANRGWNVIAIEKSEKARELSLKEFGFKMQDTDALTDIKDKELDVVTMWHVMEHIQDPDKMWNELHRILDDTGIAIIAVPNSISYDAQRYKEHWAAYDVPRHLWHFTPSSIMRWGEKHGFLLEKQLTMPFDGFYISMLSEQNRGSRLHTIRGFWNGFKGWVAQSKRRSASSSIIYVFRKKR
ncbi:MAG: class I SAM-dependent methyltransferase [Bacteroidaceae bacterium]|nr:class I SAM-dependent methyltransferase [Bacteroidaceae bacterium]